MPDPTRTNTDDDYPDDPPEAIDLSITSVGAGRALIRQVGFGVGARFTMLVELDAEVNVNHIALTVGGAPADDADGLVTVVAEALGGIADLLREQHSDLVEHIERQQAEDAERDQEEDDDADE